MAESLPPELVDLIINEIFRSLRVRDRSRSLASLSLVCRSFTAACQQRQWSTLTLYATGESSTAHDIKAILLCERIASSPHLGSYVTQLTHKLGYNSLADRACLENGQLRDYEVVAKAIRCMCNVVDFSLIYGGKTCNTTIAFDRCPQLWRDAIATIVAGPRLRELALRRVSSFPQGALYQALGNLEVLKLSKCSFGSWSPVVPVDSGTSDDNLGTPACALRSLTCDSQSYNGLNALPYINEGISLSQLEALDISVDDELGGSHGILHAAGGLQKLYITVNDSPPLAAPMHTLLSNLHLNAQTTLTHLRVVFQNVSYHPPPSTLFVPALSQLTSLRTFKLDIHIAVPTLPGYINTPILTSHGIHATLPWTQLDHMLSNLALAALRKVRVRVYVMYTLGRDGDETARNEWNARYLRDVVVIEGVFEKQMHGIRAKQREGVVGGELVAVVVHPF